ncbi:MAG: hypothetical protein KJ856_07780 [Gammaproteobacteria bacterium]|nr:hypothetical protein [Gammaproteobacteria bacterium]MBU1479821.1 hypothetical protein [Gammaproteobacteria bacterium]MBU1999511.1 hypothetical protein [Gammaproteobacteria bacterium]MBU2130680.1 hypothetical protein [Gammaproteobacteria bacterium]MBU2186918.1 hypothetical protein [Gammaproteobacteria bacterium]
MNYRLICFLFLIVTLCLSLSNAEANRYWPPKTLIEWSLSLNNGVAYISSPQFAEHCLYGRGQINMDGTEFNKSMYAYAMSAKARGLKLRYVVDDTHSTCIITGLQEVS